MERAARVWGVSETNQRPPLDPHEEEVIGIFNVCSPGDGRIPLTDIIAWCHEIGVSDVERMGRLVKFIEGEVLTVQAEEREKKTKSHG